MNLNCDIGERGEDHPVDRELMTLIDIANLACGGHAGDERSVDSFRRLADELQVQVSAHLSYPDRESFGRRSINLPWTELADALDRQWELVSDLTLVKFHGALYLDSTRDRELAQRLAGWLQDHSVRDLMCPPDTEMAMACGDLGIRVLKEAFLERRYQQDDSGNLGLVPRTHPRATISNLSEALNQTEGLIEAGTVTCIDGRTQTLRADTLCVHSDSPIALELARAVSTRLGNQR